MKIFWTLSLMLFLSSCTLLDRFRKPDTLELPIPVHNLEVKMSDVVTDKNDEMKIYFILKIDEDNFYESPTGLSSEGTSLNIELDPGNYYIELERMEYKAENDDYAKAPESRQGRARFVEIREEEKTVYSMRYLRHLGRYEYSTDYLPMTPTNF